MPNRRRSRRRSALPVGLAVPLLALSLLAGCSSGHHLGAAEPATAPPTAAAPAGLVRAVGSAPEGIVYDPTGRVVAVAVRDPDRLLLLDPDTLAVRRTVALPGSARHLQLSTQGDEILVPAETANALVQVPVGGGPLVTTPVLRQPHDAARAGTGDIVVGDEFGRALSVIRDGKVRATVRGVTQPGGVAALGATGVAVVDVASFTLSTYDLLTLRRTGRVAAGAGPTHDVVVSGARVVVTDTRGNAALVFATDPLRRVGSLALPGAPYGIAVDEQTDTVWMTLTARNEVVGLDVAGNEPRVIARYPTVRQPNTVSVDPGSHHLWITGTSAGVVELISR